MTALQVVLAALLCAAFAYSVIGYPKGYGALSGRSRLFRTSGMALLVLLLALVLIASSTAVLHGDRIGAVRHAALLLSSLLVAFSLCGVAVLDALESFVVVRRERRSALNRVIAETVEAAEKNKSDDAPNP